MTYPAQNKLKIKKKAKTEPSFLMRLVVTFLLLISVFGISIAISVYTKKLNTPPPKNFVECSQRTDSKIEESYPPVCVARNGDQFIKELSPDENPLPTQKPEKIKRICGGIAGLACPDGYTCVLDGNYPDAAGNCQLK